jgi:hypothetical protein
MKQDGPTTPWPPRSPSFILRGYVKNLVYVASLADLETLKSIINNAITSVKTCEAGIRQELETRFDIMCLINGTPVELYWTNNKLGELLYLFVASEAAHASDW